MPHDDMMHGLPGGARQRGKGMAAGKSGKGEQITVEELFQRLEGILTLETLQSMWNATNGNRDAVTAALKEQLAPHSAVLEQRGFVAEYLAYMLPYVLGPHLEAERRLSMN